MGTMHGNGGGAFCHMSLAYCRFTGNMNGEQKRRGFILLRMHSLYPYVPLSCPAPPGLALGNEQ